MVDFMSNPFYSNLSPSKLELSSAFLENQSFSKAFEGKAAEGSLSLLASSFVCFFLSFR